ncbi:ADH6 [Lachancea thermotolerans]|uniref:alcohol dehydrogenase (NADP(+)) n=1 Tax=Lachancea thermotolerans (strain ATCC 56472 / CBS 6340 / NRRL Y-8284) TaxID=559295 RepID=C5DCQ4_LACTC|nr:KLTH0B04972p [Lachancea thermotolerans CBS 6340]CAR21565.1 KLTH0B04972p [Lachancea thermotolerans CBS 6340]
MSYPEKFQGIAVQDHNDWTHPKKISYEPKKFDDYDVDVEIEACGICGSDTHCASGNWGPKSLPLVVGHEVIGRVVRVGPKCHTGVKVGDRVGVGAQVSSCLDCDRCNSDFEPYCAEFITTYSQPYPDGYVSQGGYASHIRAHEHFVIPIPEKIPTHLAAPLLCGGITVFSPLINNDCGPNKKVGIVGIGGIGHMGLIFAKALGAEVYAISRSSAKKEDAMKLGADHFIATKEEPDWEKKYASTLDLVIVCASSLTEINLEQLIKTMRIKGRIISICVPKETEELNLKPFQLSGITIGNSQLGSRKELIQLLQLVADKDLKIWVETLPISEESVHDAFVRMEKGDVRYRFTLTDFDKEFRN